MRSNIKVARHILSPRLPIDPRTITVEAGQKDELDQVVYANSITLTPGTVSLRLHEGEITVHALTAEFAKDVESGEMQRRVRRQVGGV